MQPGDPFNVPRSVAALMAGFNLPWCFCGGWAIDLLLNRPTRPHADIDLAIFRQDQLHLQKYLLDRSWQLEVAHDGLLTPWQPGEFLQLPIHGIWCRNPRCQPDFIEILLNERTGGSFLFRRDTTITRPIGQAILQSPSGLPVLAGEIVLLYKTSSSGRDDDYEADFRCLYPALSPDQRQWLSAAITRLHPSHRWLEHLASS